jgi:2-polyprenyl-3-methyl-5-hydroxy-6-metoxy-1,4-benzoquinol methylase
MYNKPNLQYGGLSSEDYYTNRRIHQIAKIISDLNFKEYNILDIGGYNGDLLFALKKYIKFKINYSIVDFDKSALKLAKKKRIKTYFTDLDNEAFDKYLNLEKKYNVIVSTECFEHLKFPTMHLERVKFNLQDGGFMIVSLPNENTLYHRILAVIGIGLDTYAFKPYKHLHLPTIKQSEMFLLKFAKIYKKQYWISAQFKYTKMKLLAFLNLLPDNFWQSLANISPGLFARGTIFVLKF